MSTRFDLRKKFNGKIYTLFGDRPKKSIAKKKASELRSHGWLVRVTYNKQRKCWEIYKRKP